ncbi:MAG: nicotinate-nucleotide adenylyltransferase [Pyrinomonadaceae bacterium]
MNRKKRIAIYGGTFDPVHLGHLEIARKISEFFVIDKLWFVPAQVAPHKLSSEVTPAVHRYAMLVLATQNDDRLLVSTFELEAPDRRYTVDTLAYFKSQLGESSEIFFVMGADSWSEITTWRNWEQLLSMVNNIVVTRPGYDVDLSHITAAQSVRVVDLRGSETLQTSEDQSEVSQGFITAAVMIDISATDIRATARKGNFDSLTGMVPQAVAEYIRSYGLYRDSNEA